MRIPTTTWQWEKAGAWTAAKVLLIIVLIRILLEALRRGLAGADLLLPLPLLVLIDRGAIIS